MSNSGAEVWARTVTALISPTDGRHCGRQTQGSQRPAQGLGVNFGSARASRERDLLCKGRRLGQARKREKAGSDGAMHVGLLNASGSPNESDGTHNAKHDAAGVACRYRYFPVAREKDWRPGGTRSPTKFAGPGPARARG